MDRKTILAVVLCFLIYIGWYKFYLEPNMPVPGTPVSAPVSSQSQDIALSTGGAPTQEVEVPDLTQTNQTPRTTLALETRTGTAQLGDGALALSNWDLTHYRQKLEKEAPQIDMESVIHESGAISLAFEDPRYGYLNNVVGTLEKTKTGARWEYSDKNVTLVRDIESSPENPYLDMKIQATFKASPPQYAFISLVSQTVEDNQESHDKQLIYFSNDSLERVTLGDVKQKEVASSIRYIGASNRYFVLAVLGQSPVFSTSGLIQPVQQNEGRISMVYPLLGVSQGSTVTLPLRVYFGPKELNLLRTVDPSLDQVVDFGWFTFFAYPLLSTLKWFYQFLQNYGLAIVLLTVLLKIVTYPLTYKSMKSMKKMAKLQPQLTQLRERYKDDREALNREMMAMMRKHGYNPMAGCVPILIQMPIFFALYRVLYSSIELYHAPFFFWIQDLSSKDPYFVTPVLLSLTMFVQQKLTPNTATDPTQAKMMQMMPLIFGAFMLYLPSGLTVYMLVNAITGIIQQLVLNKKLGHTPARA